MNRKPVNTPKSENMKYVESLPEYRKSLIHAESLPVEVLGYARYSTESQLESSIERQVESIRKIAESWNLRTPEIFADRGLSAAHTKREQLENCLLRLEQRPGSWLIIETPDRLYRSLDSYAEIYLRLNRSSTKLLNQNGLIEGYNSPLSAIIASEERKRIAERMDSGRRRVAAEGKCIGKTPYGYKRLYDGSLVIDPVTSQHVLGMFEDRSRGATIGSLARGLNERKIPPPGKAKGWLPETISRMLRNPLYIGVLRVNFADKEIK